MIDKTAIIGPNCVVPTSCHVGPYTVLEDNVVLGENVSILSNCLLRENTEIGNNTKVGSSCHIGSDPNIVADFSDINSRVIIGKNTVIRDGVVICRSCRNSEETVIGDHVNIAGLVYIAHDCIINDYVFVSSHVSIGGESSIGEYSNLGMSSIIHQYSRVGEYVMVGAQSKIHKDIPPYALVDGNPPLIKKVNQIGLRRRGFSEVEIDMIEDVYFSLYDLELYSRDETKKLTRMKEIYGDNYYANKIMNFIEYSNRGCCYINIKKSVTD